MDSPTMRNWSEALSHLCGMDNIHATWMIYMPLKGTFIAHCSNTEAKKYCTHTSKLRAYPIDQLVQGVWGQLQILNSGQNLVDHRARHVLHVPARITHALHIKPIPAQSSQRCRSKSDRSGYLNNKHTCIKNLQRANAQNAHVSTNCVMMPLAVDAEFSSSSAACMLASPVFCRQ